MNKVLASIEEPVEVTKEDFIGYLFMIRDMFNLYHLKARTYSSHIALNDAYKNLLKLIDVLVESSQSEVLLDIEIPCSSIRGIDPIDFIEECIEYIETNKNIFNKSSFQNIIDEIITLFLGTKYKLNFLK
jgi:hypothetical protein